MKKFTVGKVKRDYLERTKLITKRVTKLLLSMKNISVGI